MITTVLLLLTWPEEVTEPQVKIEKKCFYNIQYFCETGTVQMVPQEDNIYPLQICVCIFIWSLIFITIFKKCLK